MKLKSDISNIIGQNIEASGWDIAFNNASISGGLDNVKTIEIVKTICKYLDAFIPDIIGRSESINEMVKVFNPLDRDFIITVNMDNAPTTFTIKSHDSASFNGKIAIYVKHQLIKEIIKELDIPATEDAILKINEKITVKDA